MNLLRRPLRPRLRPLLLSEVTVDGQSEPISSLSSVSSSTNGSPASSRPSSHTQSAHFLPPLAEVASHHASLVTPFQSEQPTLVDHMTVAMNENKQKNSGDESDDEDDRIGKRRNLRQRKLKKLLTPLKTREYSQFSMMNREIRTPKPQTLNRTPKFKGPPGLPTRQARTCHEVKSHYSQITDDEAYAIVNEFTFNDFILHSSISKAHPYEECTLEKAFLSKYTYKQICEMIIERVWAERCESGKIHVQTLVPNIEPFQNRVPMHQIVTEMALVLRQHMSNMLGSQLKMNIRALPSWRQKEGAHTEILLYESERKREQTNDTNALTKETSNLFNLRRDTGAEISVLDCLLKSGTHLDLRAFALENLPDISLMFTTLVAADLSYNCLRTVPLELFECTKLEHLYLRHNPISSVSSGMNNLKALVFLDMSFCELHETLPDSLFGLTNLRHLDVSYNRLTVVPNGISNLKNLRQFVCDGNEITYFPSGIICMDNLKLITANNTWLISQLAQEECSNKPQKLLDLVTVRLSKYPWKRIAHKMPDSSKTLLFGAQLCDSCSGLRVGQGYRTIVTCQNLFGIKLFPILFVSCTPECLQKLLCDENNNTGIPSKNAFTIHDRFISKLKMRQVR